MTQRLSPGTALLLTVPPLLWAGNAVIGRFAVPLIPPMTLNFFRWLLALLLLLPLGGRVLLPRAGLWPHWRRYALLGLLGVGFYNALQYLALHTSTPLNVTLVASSIPVWMLAVGALFFGVRVTRAQFTGAVLSIAGVLLVLSRGDWAQLLAVRLVPGDVYVLLAALSWAFYNWMLMRTSEPVAVRRDWAAFLVAQLAPGVAWSGLFAAGEWALIGTGHIGGTIVWGWPLAGALLFVAVGPALIAFRSWGAGVERAGPGVASFFVNLTPLFAALLSAAFLGETPRWYHGAAFLLIVAGIVVSSRR